MEITISILVYVLCLGLTIGGLIFSVLPPIPGPILNLMAMFALHFWHPYHSFPNPNLLWIMTGVTIAVLVVENLMPIFLTKKYGGSKQGIWGSTIGLLVGMFFLPANIIFPFNLILGLFAGAMIGEFIAGNDLNTAFRSGWGSFIGFLTGNGLKLVVAIIMTVQTIRAIF